MMEGQYDNSIAPQQNQNIIQVNQPQLYDGQSPGIEMNPIVNNQIDNANQPMINNQVNPIPIHTIPLSDINSWGSIPHKVTCPYCHQNVTTSVTASCNMGSCCLCFWLSCIIWAIILLSMGKEIGCADATHKCPNCKNIIGVYRSC